MHVKILQTLPFKVTDAATLVAKIKREGVKSDGFPGGVTTIKVDGLYFLLGGRNSIAEFLSKTPGGLFVANNITVRYTRRNTIGKHYTIVAIAPGPLGMYLDTSRDPWFPIGNSYVGLSVISFEDIATNLWKTEEKITESILVNTGLIDPHQLQKPVKPPRGFRSYGAGQ
jgi:hypothetical protein